MQTVKDEMEMPEEIQEEAQEEAQEVKEPVRQESEIEKVLKMKKDEQISYLLGEIEILRNNQSVIENRLARYKKLKKA